MGNRKRPQIDDPRDAQPLESLEKRILLAAATAGSIGDVKNGPMANSGPELIALYREYHTYALDGGVSTKFTSSDTNLVMNSGRVAVTVHGTGTISDVTNDVRAVGGLSVVRDSSLRTVDAFIPVSSLHTLADEKGVISVSPVIAPSYNSVGSAPNQADQAENADKARSLYGLDGTGVKVGVLSDSADAVGLGLAGSIATGDLPPNVQDLADDTLPADGAQDEGRAMMELIHDIAPGAALSFATAAPTQTSFADNIRRLADNGANVIVDDVTYFEEPMFQPGVIDDAIHDVTQNGVTYLSSAGNNANSGFEEPINFVQKNGVTDVDFDPGPGVSTRLQISFPQGQGGALFSPFTLEWDNPYNGVTGNATSDLDVYFYDPHSGRLLFSSTANNLKTGLPVEFTEIALRTMDVEIRLAGHVAGTPLPTEFKFVVPSNASNMVTSFPQFQTAIFGHNGGQDVISVGAVPFTNVPPFTAPNQPINNETFSSSGPETIFFDADGNRLPTPLVLDKPDLSGVDGVDVSFPFANQPSTDSDSLTNFFGTSAAAPDVAGVVALIKQASPDATQAQILSALESTARPTNSSPAGQWDPQGGFGLVDAQAAVAQFVANPTARIVQVTPNPTDGPIESMKIVFSQQVSGFDVSDLILSVDGGPNLLTGDNAPTTTDGGRSWVIHNLQTATDAPGLYELELTNATGLIKNAVGLPFDGDVTSSYTNEGPQSRPAPPSSLSAKVLSDSQIQLNWSDNSSNEDGFVIQRSTSSDFSTALKNLKVSTASTTSFVDKSLSSGTTYFYRIRAFNNFAGNSTYSNVATGTTLSASEVILDNESSSGVKVVGSWDTSSSTPGFFGSSYLDDQDSGKGDKSVTYTPNLSKAGSYFVYARWTTGHDRATNVPFTVNGKKITVDERDTGGDGWVLLGKFSMSKGTGNSVVISNAGTNGLVVADAVEFLPAG